MGKRLVLTLISFSIILALIAGCGDGTKATTGAAVASVCNSPYFEFKVGECCLDKNSNRICDTDESIAEPVKETTEEKTETTTETTTETAPATVNKEIEITVQDLCTDTSYFKCLTSYITKDEVFFKLKAASRTGQGFLHLKKVSALSCEKTFADKQRTIDGYPIGQELIVSIPCRTSSPGQEIKDSEYILEYIFYPDDDFINPSTGQWEGATRLIQKSSGQISGTVRNEPKKIL